MGVQKREPMSGLWISPPKKGNQEDFKTWSPELKPGSFDRQKRILVSTWMISVARSYRPESWSQLAKLFLKIPERLCLWHRPSLTTKLILYYDPGQCEVRTTVWTKHRKNLVDGCLARSMWFPSQLHSQGPCTFETYIRCNGDHGILTWS